MYIYIYIQHTEIDLDSVEPSFEVSLDLARGPRSGTFLPSERSLPHSWKVDMLYIQKTNATLIAKKEHRVMSFSLPLTISLRSFIRPRLLSDLPKNNFGEK